LLDIAPSGKEKAPRTLERYGELLNTYVVPRIGAQPIQRITPAVIEALYVELERSGGKGGRPLSRKTVLHVHRVLFMALKDAARLGVLARNPAESVNTPTPQKSPAKAVSAEQFDAIVTQLEKEERGDWLLTVAMLGATSAMRRGELMGLRWGDVDLDKRTLSVQRAVSKTKARGLFLKTPKGGRARLVRISAEEAELLRQHKLACAEKALACGVRLSGAGFVFPASIAEPETTPYDPDKITGAFARLLERLKIKERGLSFHSLRHYAATWMLKRGALLKAVSERLGHANPNITLDIYQHVTADMQEHAAEMAGEILRRVKKPA